MTEDNRKIYVRICEYAEKVLGDINPQETPISVQLDALKPIMEEIAKEKNMKLEDVFILYMDLASEAGVAADAKLKSELEDGGIDDFSRKANSF